MRTKLLYLTFIIITPLAFAQTTYVPDDNFEQYLINEGYDDVLDDYVLTANIDTVTQMVISNRNISDLTGIEDFTALSQLNCNTNQISTVDFSQNTNLTFLSCTFNQIDGTLDLSQNTLLEQIHCRENLIDELILPATTTLQDLTFWDNQLTSLDVSQNPNLGILRGNDNLINGTFDLSQNLAIRTVELNNNNIDNLVLPESSSLLKLWCRENQLTELNVGDHTALRELLCGNNQITNLNLSLNTALERLTANNNLLSSLDLSNNSNLIYLGVPNNNLDYISVKNGNNYNFIQIPNFVNNPLLTCIEVDDAVFSTNNWTDIDSQSYFSEDCSNLSTDEFNEVNALIFPNPVIDELFLNFKTLEHINYQLVSLNGRLVFEGRITKKNESLDLSEISSGVYFLKLQTLNRSIIKKVVKQ
ncbi:T9SS type A sorting domain-containing protein [Winogradskyella forsetii]|uniref:T9SS type A sorting domain-containing protein n=1 Tax=Winogradskyella forsetii TaxID=2686077 RepID=UPI0015BC093D|nr:T9SS type A sorting domain-containing protein [Winogradskyella forsetii]